MALESYYGGSHQTAKISTGNPATVNDATRQNPEGVLHRWKNNTYRYVKYSTGTGTVAASAKAPAYWKTLDADDGSFVVTADQTDSLYGINGVAGVLLGVITNNYWGWIQVGGLATVTADGAQEGAMLIGSTTDSQFDVILSGSSVTAKVYGVCAEGSTTSGATAILQNLAW